MMPVSAMQNYIPSEELVLCVTGSWQKQRARQGGARATSSGAAITGWTDSLCVYDKVGEQA